MRNAAILKSVRAGLVTCSLMAAAASGSTRSGSYSQSYGNTTIGGTISVTGSMANSSSSSSAMGRVSGTIRLFGYSREAGNIEARGSQSFGSGSGSVTVRVGGYTVWSRSLSVSGSQSFSTYLDLFTPDPRLTYWVGPVPVTASGNVGVGANLNLNWTLVAPTLSAGLDGSAGAFGYGRATASLGVPGYNVGVQFALNFANHQLAYGLNANRTGISGYLSYNLNPLNLVLDLVVNFWPWQWTRNLVTYSFPSVSRSIL